MKRKVLSLNGNKSIVSLCLVNSFRLSIVQQEKEMTDNILTVVSLHVLYLLETLKGRLEIHFIGLLLILINMSDTFQKHFFMLDLFSIYDFVMSL